MTDEQKQLLLKDLCARLPYGVTCGIGNYEGQLTLVCPKGDYCILQNSPYAIENVKPYLRPMSSMTEEESKEFALLQTDFYVDGILYPIAAINMVNWLISHHFDYCGFIEKKLALEAPDGMYKTE